MSSAVACFQQEISTELELCTFAPGLVRVGRRSLAVIVSSYTLEWNYDDALNNLARWS